MNTRPKSPTTPPASISMHDIYYVLFRHKWLTSILVALGVGSSLAVYLLWPFPYVSEAMLYIKYIKDTPAPAELDGNSSVRSPDDRGANILNTELEMIASLDTAKVAASMIGADKVLGEPLPTNAAGAYDAAAGHAILANLKAEVPFKTDMILLHYSAKDPDLAPQVLRALISAYKSNYVAIHMAMGIGEADLASQVDISKGQLQDAMKNLESVKTNAGIMSLPDSKKEVTEFLSKTEQGIYEVRTELAENEALISDLQDQRGTNASATNASTNAAITALPEPASPEVVDKYRNLMAIRTARQADEQKWLSQLNTNNPLVKNAQRQRAAAEDDVQKFEDENPGLFAVKSNVAGNPAFTSTDPLVMLRLAEGKRHSLAARLKSLVLQRAAVQEEAIRLDVAEDSITKAETEKEVMGAKYKHFLTSQEQARINDAIGDKVSFIHTAEQPTPGGRDPKKTLKAAGGVLGVFLALAFGLPFFIEMVLDQSFKQPMDVKARIAAPFFITIPLTNGHRKLPALKQAKPVGLLSAHGTAKPDAVPEGSVVTRPANGQAASLDERRELRPFFETLRDRLMTYFEMINLTHKPKLVAVTSCGEGAGVTTTAAGLASSLSEVGDGNVLLVNMNVRDGQAHHFYKGKLACGIEELLGQEKRGQAQVHEHLYVANETGSGDSLPRVLPKRFSHLVPLMKASDYDYIIFDMPPVSEISITPRLARFMDMVLLVIESGKTSHEAGMQAASLLAESKTNVGLVLNKNRSYLPKRLQNI